MFVYFLERILRKSYEKVPITIKYPQKQNYINFENKLLYNRVYLLQQVFMLYQRNS